MMSTRDPYPFPTVQNDDDFFGTRSEQQQPYGLPTHLAQKQDPWNRLNTNATLSSGRREVYHRDPKAPHDSLDFVLKANYNQHKEFLKGSNETLLQPETLGHEHGRVLKNRTYHVPPQKHALNHPLRTSESPKKEHPHNIKVAIEGNHTQTTNRGYSRKPDGGFFTS